MATTGAIRRHPRRKQYRSILSHSKVPASIDLSILRAEEMSQPMNVVEFRFSAGLALRLRFRTFEASQSQHAGPCHICDGGHRQTRLAGSIHGRIPNSWVVAVHIPSRIMKAQ
jgi:hypothetical protein